MKKNLILVALLALILPVAARGLWFYRGIPPQRPTIKTPDYPALKPAVLPLQAPKEETKLKQTPGVILEDYAHGNQYQPHEIQTLRDALEKRGGKIETLTDSALLSYKLKYASAYVVASPSAAFTEDEIDAVNDFVSRGGRLLVLTDATRGVIYSDFFSGSIVSYSDANAVNPLLAPHGIVVKNDYLYNVSKNDGNFRNVFFENFEKDELTFGLKQVALYGVHSLKAPQGKILLRGDELTLSSADDSRHPEEGGAALSADRNVLAFGDFTFLASPYFNAADNATLIANIADFVLGGRRQVSLQNYPFVFQSGTVRLYAALDSSATPLTAEAVSAIGGLQTALDAAGVSLEMAEEAPSEGDLIILGLFSGDAALLEEFLQPFDLTPPMEDEESFYVPSFGAVGRYGNGLVLLDETKKGNRLILLADTPEDLLVLIEKAASGALEGCALQGNLAVCGIGFGGEYSGGDESAPAEEPAQEASG